MKIRKIGVFDFAEKVAWLQSQGWTLVDICCQSRISEHSLRQAVLGKEFEKIHKRRLIVFFMKCDDKKWLESRKNRLQNFTFIF